MEWSGFAVFRDLPLQCDLTDEGEADPESSLFHSKRREFYEGSRCIVVRAHVASATPTTLQLIRGGRNIRVLFYRIPKRMQDCAWFLKQHSEPVCDVTVCNH